MPPASAVGKILTREGACCKPLIGCRPLVLSTLDSYSDVGTLRAFSHRIMDSITALAASGLRARMESMDLLANNVANASTAGFKGDREFYSLYAGSADENTLSPSTMPVVERPWTDHSQGALLRTGNPLDLALDGKGFFAVDGPGGPLFTRNGNFRLGAGGRLTTADGYAVRSRQGTPMLLNASRNIQIGSDGTVTQDGQ